MGDGDLLEATTRNYGRQGPALAPSGSAPLPPSIGDAVAGDTARYQQQIPVQPVGPMGPIGPMGPAYMPPGRMPVADTAAFKGKKRRRILKWGAFFLAMLMSAGIGAAINDESNNDDRIHVSMEDRVRLARMQTEDRLRDTLTGSIADYHERIREDLERKIEAVDRAKEEAERAIERGDGGTDVKPLDLVSYEYQGASGGQYSRIPGRELVTQRTNDNFETVSKFYQEKMGRPLAQITERNRKESLFQTVGSPSATVLIRESRDRGRQTEIIIVRSPARFPTLQPDPDAGAADKSKTDDARRAPAPVADANAKPKTAN
jgi:hypothetical protein